MKTKPYFLIIVFLFQMQNNIFAQWVQQTNDLDESWSIGLAIDACDSQNVVFSARWKDNEAAKVFITNNGGLSWINITPFNTPGKEFEDISIIDSLHIWGVSDYGKIFATKDGGENWNIQFYDSTLTTYMNYIEMFDLDNGIAMGDGLSPEQHPAVFLKTTNGGNTWVSINDSAFGGYTADNWRRLGFINMDSGYFCESGIGVQTLFKTTNGGSKWEFANYEGGLQILKFYNKDIGLLKESNYNPEYSFNFKRTLDGGASWESFAFEPDGWGNDIEFLPNNPSKVWYVDGYGMHSLYSNDTGRTWTEQTMPVENSAGRDIVFTDDKHGWILCDEGKLFYTNNNGGIITDVEKEKPNNLPTEFKLQQNFPNPFNPSTTIKYSIPVIDEKFSSTTNVILQVYDILGKEVATLVNKKQSAGNYSVLFDAKELTSGIYIYSMQVGEFTSSRKFVLIK